MLTINVRGQWQMTIDILKERIYNNKSNIHIHAYMKASDETRIESLLKLAAEETHLTDI